MQILDFHFKHKLDLSIDWTEYPSSSSICRWPKLIPSMSSAENGFIWSGKLTLDSGHLLPRDVFGTFTKHINIKPLLPWKFINIYGFKVKRNVGSPIHQQKRWQSLNFYKLKRAGHVTPLRLKKKCEFTPPSSSPYSSPNNNPFSKRFLYALR